MNKTVAQSPLETAEKERLRLWLRMLKTTRSIEAKLRENFRAEFATTLPRFDVMAAEARDVLTRFTMPDTTVEEDV